MPDWRHCGRWQGQASDFVVNSGLVADSGRAPFPWLSLDFWPGVCRRVNHMPSPAMRQPNPLTVNPRSGRLPGKRESTPVNVKFRQAANTIFSHCRLSTTNIYCLCETPTSLIVLDFDLVNPPGRGLVRGKAGQLDGHRAGIGAGVTAGPHGQEARRE